MTQQHDYGSTLRGGLFATRTAVAACHEREHHALLRQTSRKSPTGVHGATTSPRGCGAQFPASQDPRLDHPAEASTRARSSHAGFHDSLNPGASRVEWWIRPLGGAGARSQQQRIAGEAVLRCRPAPPEPTRRPRSGNGGISRVHVLTRPGRASLARRMY